MKRTRHIRSTISRMLALSVSIAATLAVMTPAGAGAAPLPRWTVAADSGATPPPPAPAPTDTVTAPAAAEPAPGDTARAPAPIATPLVIPPPAPPTPAPPTLTKKQVRAQEKEKRRAEKLATKEAKHPKQAKQADVDSLAAWNAGMSWLMLRGGFARSGEPDGSGHAVGAALGYQHFLTARWALGFIAQGDLLGKFGAAAEIEYPITLELTRHFRWKTALRPYMGAGGGAYYHRFYRTGNDSEKLQSGAYLVGGFNAPVGKRSILGIDGRMQFVSGDKLVTNPVFGTEDAQLMHYSLKLGWSVAF